MVETSYLIGLGSNRYRSGSPRSIIQGAIGALAHHGVAIIRISSIASTAPLGPGSRNYANAAILARTDLEPPELFTTCQSIERQFGGRTGRRWGDRTLDIDLLLWSDGCWSSGGLEIPHPAIAERRFVLAPLVEIAPGWRHPIHCRTIRQLFHMRQRNMPVDHRPNHP